MPANTKVNIFLMHSTFPLIPLETLDVTYPDSATVSRTHFVEAIFAQQIEEGAIGL